ncbi:MAG: alpha/beta fold hydrolase [Acidimicrobiia bacterium]
MTAIDRHNVTISGVPGGQPLVFAHGFGCDQNMWRYVTPAFEDRFQIVTFDYIGHGGSACRPEELERYGSLDAYADDLLGICRAMELHDVVLVGHSVSSMICVLAATREPERFAKLVLVAPSPRYIDDEGYTGGFTEADIDGLLESLESNYLGWSSAMAPVIMGNEERPALGEELEASFCRTDPALARQFARATFLSDSREDLAGVSHPTLVLQCTNDAIAPVSVGEYVRDALPDGRMVMLEATGHCPHLSAPRETIAAMADFLGA